MISKKTVFVLGAGTSMPYGFPSGASLRKILCAPANGHSKEIDWIASITKLGISPLDSIKFARAFLDSGVGSIDSFLSRRSKEFGEIGKFAIAAVLCNQEEPSRFRNTDIEDDWYNYLWNALIAGVHECEDLAANQIRFVTFNYDRSLEYYLRKSCQETFGVSYADAVKALEPLQIIHMYGQLGKLDQATSSDSRSYENFIGASELRIAAEGIKIISESRDEAPEFDEARKLFGWAEQICFLGFGFDHKNMSRLNLESVCKERRLTGRSIRIIASTYGRMPVENSAVMNSIPSSNGWWEMEYGESLSALRKKGVLL